MKLMNFDFEYILHSPGLHTNHCHNFPSQAVSDGSANSKLAQFHSSSICGISSDPGLAIDPQLYSKAVKFTEQMYVHMHGNIQKVDI